MRARGVGEREDAVDVDARAPRADELVGALEVRRHAHRRAEDGELLPPEPVEASRRAVARGRAAHDDPAVLSCGGERALPGRLADGLDDDVRARAAGRVLHGLHDVGLCVVDGEVRAERACLLELLVARRRDDRARAERSRDLEGCQRDAAADAPDEHPLAFSRAAFVTSMRYAVSKVSGNAAASSNESASSSGYSWAAGIALSSQYVPSVCSPITVIRPLCGMPGLTTTRSPTSKPSTPSPSAATTPEPSAPRIRGFGTEGRPLRTQTSRWFSAAARSDTSTSPGPAIGIVDVLVAKDVGPSVLVYAHGLHEAESSHDRRRADGAGDRARHRRDRRRSGRALRRHRTAHPRSPLARALRRHEVHDGPTGGLVSSRASARGRDDASSRVRSATTETGRSRRSDEGRLPRYTWRDEYAELRTRLDALGERLGGAYRVLVDESEHVDRAGAVRAGIAFYGKNTMAITRRHGSWVVLGALVTEVEVEPSPPLDLDCGECRLCIDACPTGALDEPGTLDATKCLSYWTQAPSSIPDEYRAELGAMVYGCDICQEVCPWNRGVEKRRRGVSNDDARGVVSLVDWLDRDGDELDRRARSPLRSPQRRALASTQRTRRGRERRRRELAPAVARYVDDDDPILSDAARWAVGRIAERQE